MKHIAQIKALAIVFALFLFWLPLSSKAADTPAPQAVAPHEKVVFQVSDSIPEKWNLTLNNARNVQNLFGKSNVDIEIVAYGPGIDMLKFESEVGERIGMALADGVKVVACENTMKSKKLVKADMLQTIGYVPNGVAELMKKQKEGWSYIRP
jgi:intracellular sulfur oxidation DsrE/DsrF family protein